MAGTSDLRTRRKIRQRYKIKQTSAGKVRLTVNRTNQHTYAQIVDPSGKTLCSASTVLSEASKLKNGSNKDAIFAVSTSNGESLALAQHFESNDIFLMNITNSSSRIVATKPTDTNVSSLYLNTNEQLYIGYENGVIQQLDTKVTDNLLQVTTNNSAVKKLIQLGEFLVSGHANGQVYVWRIANE